MIDLYVSSKSVRDEIDEALEMDLERTKRLDHVNQCDGTAGQYACMECVESRHFLRKVLAG